ncbi:MAG: ribosome assembly factor SBDS [Candidatus Geothermarchaeota archaeon]
MSGYTIARFKYGTKRFEILVDPDRALEFKLNKRRNVDGILVYDEVFIDVGKGIRASKADLMEAFGTTDLRAIVERILKEGELLLRAEQRRKLVEEKKRQIIEYLSKYCIDARTGLPIPPQRLENLLKDVSLRIDPFKPVEEQIKGIIEEINKVLPIKQQVVTVSLKVPAAYASKVYGYLKNVFNIVSEAWLDDGSLSVTVNVPSGLKLTFLDKINKLTSSTARFESIRETSI